jgi:hypothetical protein
MLKINPQNFKPLGAWVVSAVVYRLGHRLDGPGFKSQWVQENFLCSKTSIDWL